MCVCTVCVCVYGVCVCTCGETVHQGSSGRMVDNVRSIIEVVKVVTTIKTPEAKHMVQHQVLTRRDRTCQF